MIMYWFGACAITHVSNQDDDWHEEDYLNRLHSIAKSLPRRWVEKLLESIPARIQSVLDAKAFTPKKD